MALSPGDKLGPYEILALIGRGGMGEVWKARDPRVGRDVAIKVSAAQFSERFEREAKAIGALNHPNICTLYDVGPHYLVMEYVEGAPLKGPLPLDQALKYAVQICAALDHAHKKGITHRDLKPANILVTKAGVKLVDFGLARVARGAEDTLTIPGLVMGTPAYMSPEQWEGRSGDARSDIFAFGRILVELLTGQRDVPAPGSLPGHDLETFIQTCLEKDPEDRWQSAWDLKKALALLAQHQTISPAAPSRRAFLAVSTTAGAVLGTVAGWILRRGGTESDRQPAMNLNVDLGRDALDPAGGGFALSPDGTMLVYRVRTIEGVPGLATRLLDKNQLVPLAGTVNGRDPFFSADGLWIGFFADGKLKKIPSQGGPVVSICDAPNGQGAAWGENGLIVAALTGAGLARVSADNGASPETFTNPTSSGEVSHRRPQILLGGRLALYTASSSNLGFEGASVVVKPLEGGPVKTLVRGGYFGRYVSNGGTSGYLVYVSEGVLRGIPFDPKKAELRGPAVELVDDLACDPGTGWAGAEFSILGNMVYAVRTAADVRWPVVWLDGSGQITSLLDKPGTYYTPSFSPDGSRLALAVAAGRNRNIFVYDERRDVLSRVTSGPPEKGTPVWAPDGVHLVYGNLNGGALGLQWVRADGASTPSVLLPSKTLTIPWSFTPDGRRVAYSQASQGGGYGLWTLPLDLSNPDKPVPGTPERFLETPNVATFPAISPDGRWVAYQSNETGVFEVYVRPYPEASRKWQISNGGGRYPCWSRSGRELFYESEENRIMAVSYSAASEGFTSGKPRVWSDRQIRVTSTAHNLAMHPDGKRFAVFPVQEAVPQSPEPKHLSYVLGFVADLERRLSPSPK